MIRHLICLPDGTELFSGAGAANAIQSAALTECVNSGEELTLGSACANMLEVTVLSSQGGLSLTAGDEVTLFKVDDAGTRHKAGVFILEKPTKPTANTMKLLGYDRVVKLDKELTGWLKRLNGWPYRLHDFAGMVCQACGLTLASTDIPNADFPVQQFSREVTGRQLMRWIGEVCCRFCRANADGEIELAWFTPAGVSITPSGDYYFFHNGLSYEEYQVEPIDAVQLRLADSGDGMLWPAAAEGANSYIISDNPLLAAATEDLLPVLQAIQSQLPSERYTPCKVSLPATLDIHAGDIVRITDKNSASITAYIMTKTQSGQTDTLECTGSARRDSAGVQNNRSVAEIAQQAVNNQTQQDIFVKLTDNGAIKGLFMKDGQLYVNASYLATGIIRSEDGAIVIDLSEGAAGPVFNTGISTNGVVVRGDEVDAPTVFSVEAKRYDGSGAETVEMKLYSANGKQIGLLQETFADASYNDPAGVFFRLLSQGQTLKAETYANDSNAGIRLVSGEDVLGYFHVNSSGDTEFSGNAVNAERVVATGFSVFNSLSASRINPGKRVLYSGSVTAGSTFEVPNTANYDLFAVKLGDDAGNAPSVVLAYKYGDTVYGVGGWCGTATQYKELYFVSITFSADTWTLVDAGVHDVYKAGSIGSGTQLQVKEVIGII